MKKAIGFTMIELMIVVAIIAFLAMIALPSYLRFVARSKRAEAHINLASLYTAEKAYWAEHGTYTTVLNGANGLAWRPEGKAQYTYGFGGAADTNYIQGVLPSDLSALSQAKADKSGFVAIAVGDIDGDGKPDVLSINDKKELVTVTDDLQ